MENKESKDTFVFFFTEEEIECVKNALNFYDLLLMDRSKTWGSPHPRESEDYWHKKANICGRLWVRIVKTLHSLAETK